MFILTLEIVRTSHLSRWI